MRVSSLRLDAPGVELALGFGFFFGRLGRGRHRGIGRGGGLEHLAPLFDVRGALLVPVGSGHHLLQRSAVLVLLANGCHLFKEALVQSDRVEAEQTELLVGDLWVDRVGGGWMVMV